MGRSRAPVAYPYGNAEECGAQKHVHFIDAYYVFLNDSYEVH